MSTENTRKNEHGKGNHDDSWNINNHQIFMHKSTVTERH